MRSYAKSTYDPDCPEEFKPQSYTNDAYVKYRMPYGDINYIRSRDALIPDAARAANSEGLGRGSSAWITSFFGHMDRLARAFGLVK